MLSLTALPFKEVDADGATGQEAGVMKKKDLRVGDVTEVVEVAYGVPRRYLIKGRELRV
jgi:hypothetical protein